MEENPILLIDCFNFRLSLELMAEMLIFKYSLKALIAFISCIIKKIYMNQTKYTKLEKNIKNTSTDQQLLYQFGN